MSQQVELTRSDLYSLRQAGLILGVERRKLSGAAEALGIEYKSDPTRNGNLLDRADLRRIASALGRSLDWERIEE